MAFTTIDPSTIEVGDSVKKELFDRVKDNFDDHESRINNLEISSAKISFFKFLFMNAARFQTATGLYYYEADEDFIITNAYIRIFEKTLTSGILEFDIKKSVTNMDGINFTSIFTTKPSINFATAVDYQPSVNQVFNSAQITINKGDFLRLDITSMPTGGVLPKVLFTAYGE